MEGKVCTVFNRIGVDVKPDDIEACHRLYNDNKTIVKFSKRKVCQQVLQVKKELKSIDPSKFDFPEDTAIFINESLCSSYKMLWNKCKKLWEKKLICTYIIPQIGIFDTGLGKMGMFIQVHILRILKRIFQILT